MVVAQLDVQGHRGARGVFPENSIPAFKYGAKVGATTLEMDVVISKDGKIVVSHEPWMSAGICSHPDGRPVQEKEDKSLRIYEMNYDEVRQYDCGSRGNSKFEEQKAMATYKPLLSEVIDTIEHFVSSTNRSPIHYNIEIKSRRKGDGKYHPKPEEFVKRVHDLLAEKGIMDKVIIQSFDARSLRAMRALDPNVKLAYLVAIGRNIKRKVKKLGFTPDTYSPRYALVNQKTIDFAHRKNIKVIPWTVNDPDKIKELIDMGVDGIITDYPKRCIEIAQEAGVW